MKVIRGLVAAVLILAIGAVVLIVALPGEKIAKLAADQVKAMTGRELTFEGKVGISWYPVLGVTTEKVSFGNAAWSERGPMFTADKAVIGVDVMAAIGGNIRVKNVELVAPDVLLEKTADGRVNWDLSAGGVSTGAQSSGAPSSGEATPEPAPTAETGLENFALERLVIRDAQVRYIEHGAARQELSGVSLQMAWPGVDKAADLTVKVSPFGAPLTVDATIAAPLEMMAGGVSPVELALQAGGGTATFSGRAGIAPEASGKLNVTAPDAAVFLAALGAGGLEGPLAVAGDVTLTRTGVVSVRGGQVSAMGNDLSVQADVNLNGPRPKVAAQVATQTLRFVSEDGEGGGAANDNAAPVGWSKAPIDASALALVDGTISFAAEAMDLNGITFGKTRATVEIDRARAVATLQEMQAYEGAVSGTFVANNRSGFSVRGDLKVAQIALQPFLAATADLDRFTGKADFESRFLSSGASLDALMNNMSGDGRVEVGRGTIEGMDLDKLLRGDVTGGTTVFNSMVATWTIADGVLTNNDLLMSLSRLAATGKGTVGLGLRTIDYVFSPQLRGPDGPSLIVPVKITGSWSNPSIVPDLEKALKRSFDKEIKAAEDEAKQKLEKELGLEKQEGQSTEDAIKDKLEKEALRGLQNLLGGN
ncbi:AsmA family protein [Shimia sagamensis]|uniref:AsmA protein n=1 Tax=Shimia sagamensis TaxID=1566352 RepID=A0ABY1NS64_9RHOB|nr:AsmA family protein [Shimia sagamensis]SMP14622.1 AsmA protein [Shimia sagamensis]